MKKIALAICLLMSAGSTLIISCNNQNETKAVTKSGITVDSMIHRGEYLVTIMGCDDCHTPKVFGPEGPQLDMTKRLSGHPASMPLPSVDGAHSKDWVLFNPILTAYVGPWGTSFSANLTSDETGIGNWTEQQFMKAMRQGKSKGLDNGRPLLPPMPWQNISKASDEDLHALFIYLKSTKPINNLVPAPIPPAQIAEMAVEPK